MIKISNLISENKLRVFDFDDTLVKSNSLVNVLEKDTKKVVKQLTPAEFVNNKLSHNEYYDFSDFDNVKDPKLIKWTINLLQKILNKTSRNKKVAILTARGSEAKDNITNFLKSTLKNSNKVEVITLGNSDPYKKSEWIENQIKNGYNDILFMDDSMSNVNAVKKLKEKYPNVKLDVRKVWS